MVASKISKLPMLKAKNELTIPTAVAPTAMMTIEVKNINCVLIYLYVVFIFFSDLPTFCLRGVII